MRVRDDQLPTGAGTGARDVPARPAASVIVLRGEPYEVLMFRRNAASSFVPGAWVFPGGGVDDVDREIAAEIGGSIRAGTAPSPLGDLDVMRVCAARELLEEAGVWLGAPLADAKRERAALLDDAAHFRTIFASSPFDLETLVWTSRWVTPLGVPKRYDTYFFLAKAGAETSASPEHHEGVEVLWIRPDEALARHRRDELPLVFPTIRNLEAIVGFDSVDALIASRKGAVIEPIQPMLVVGENGEKRLVVPGER